MFEHSKDNEPENVGDDEWFAVVQLSGTQYKLGKVVCFLVFLGRMIYSLQTNWNMILASR